MFEQFCRSILRIVTRNSKALANLVMGLASQPLARSVVEISLSNSYNYQHSSINKVIDGLDKKLYKEKKKGADGKPIADDVKLNRLEVEKKFTNQGVSFSQTVRRFLFDEYRYKFIVPSSFSEFTSTKTCL